MKAQQELEIYLENVVTLEKNAYVQTRMLKKIDGAIAQLGKAHKVTMRKVERESLFESFLGGLAICAFLGIIIGAIVGWCTWGFRGIISYAIRYCLIGAVIGIIPGIIMSINDKIGEKKEQIKAEQEYNNKVAAEQRMVALEKEKAKYLRREKELLVSQHEQTKKILNQYYEKGVLYPTYRNMIAVCSICEYIKSGRCVKLEGHDGAYNLYENERRLDRIVERLDVVIEKLDRIRASQYMLYTTIQDGNRIMNKLLDETYRQTELQNFTAEQSAITAYNSSVAVQEAHLSNWLKVYELSRDGE